MHLIVFVGFHILFVCLWLVRVFSTW